MGVRIAEPDGRALEIQPHIPKTLSFVELDLPLPTGGMLHARFKRENGIGRYEITAPKEVILHCKGEDVTFIRTDD